MAKMHVDDKGKWQEDGDGDVSDLDSDSNEKDEDEFSTQESSVDKGGLANVMAKILNRQLPKHKQVILAKALTEKEATKRKKVKKETEKMNKDVENEGPVKEDNEDRLSVENLEKKKMWEEMGRVKPDPLERNKERELQRIAQRGVVQLFNAVRKQQKLLEEKIAEVGSSDRKQSNVIKNMTKGNFLDLLKETNVSSQAGDDDVTLKKKIKLESPEQDGEEEKTWKILREDFMMGGKMKDWDKQISDDDNEPEGHSDLDDSESDNG